MHLLYQIFIDPFVQMGTAPDLLAQTLWEGLVGGVLYALIALGFVLIFKASGVFNFAQGAMVLLAGLALVRSLDLMVAMNRLISGWLTSGRNTTRSVTRPSATIAAIASGIAIHSDTPNLALMPTQVNAAKNTIAPCAKLNTPDAL